MRLMIAILLVSATICSGLPSVAADLSCSPASLAIDVTVENPEGTVDCSYQAVVGGFVEVSCTGPYVTECGESRFMVANQVYDFQMVTNPPNFISDIVIGQVEILVEEGVDIGVPMPNSMTSASLIFVQPEYWTNVSVDVQYGSSKDMTCSQIEPIDFTINSVFEGTNQSDIQFITEVIDDQGVVLESSLEVFGNLASGDELEYAFEYQCMSESDLELYTVKTSITSSSDPTFLKTVVMEYEYEGGVITALSHAIGLTPVALISSSIGIIVAGVFVILRSRVEPPLGLD